MSGIDGEGTTSEEARDRPSAGVEHDIAGAALDALEPGETEEIERLAGIGEAPRVELDSLRAAAAELAYLAPAAPMNRGRSAGIRSRLVARAASSRAGRPPGRGATLVDLNIDGTPASARAPRGATPPRPTRTLSAPRARSEGKPAGTRSVSGWGRAAWVAFAAVAAAVVAVLFWRGASENAARDSVADAREATVSAQVAELRGELASRDSIIASLTAPRTRVIDMFDYTAPGPHARVFWDQRAGEWTVYAHALRRPAPGRTYQVWLIARGRAPIPAATFTPAPDGSAVVHFRHELAAGALRRIVITEEPASGAVFPSGRAVVVGS